MILFLSRSSEASRTNAVSAEQTRMRILQSHAHFIQSRKPTHPEASHVYPERNRHHAARHKPTK
jgi:hypothetical protein